LLKLSGDNIDYCALLDVAICCQISAYIPDHETVPFSSTFLITTFLYGNYTTLSWVFDVNGFSFYITLFLIHFNVSKYLSSIIELEHTCTSDKLYSGFNVVP